MRSLDEGPLRKFAADLTTSRSACPTLEVAGSGFAVDFSSTAASATGGSGVNDGFGAAGKSL